MDIVYILGSGSKWNDNELRYSLRSLKNLDFLPGKVVIIGECPDWINKLTVRHIKFEEVSAVPAINAREKIRAAVKSPVVSTEFLLMNDDFFFTKPWKTIPVYAKQPLEFFLNDYPNGDGWYYDCLKNTYEALREKGICHPWDYTMHFPYVIYKPDAHTVFDEMKEVGRTMLFRLYYLNMQYRGDVTAVGHDGDFKAVRTEQIKKIAEKRGFFSCDDGSVNDPDFRLWIDTLYSEPSKYENL